MIDDDTILTDKEIMKEALDHLSEACCFLFELQTTEGESLAFMVDSCLKLGQILYHEDSPLEAACDYASYEEELYQRHLKEKKLKLIK